MAHCPECGADRTPWTTRWDTSRVEVSLWLLVWGLPLLLVGVCAATIVAGIPENSGRPGPSVMSETTFRWCLVPVLAFVVGAAMLRSALLAYRWRWASMVVAAATVCGLLLGADGRLGRGWVGVDSAGAVVLVNTSLAQVGAFVALIGGTAMSVVLARSLVRLGREHGVHVRGLMVAAAAVIIASLLLPAICDVWEAATATRLPHMSFNSTTGIARPSQQAEWSHRAEPYARTAAGLGIVGLWTATLFVRARVTRA